MSFFVVSVEGGQTVLWARSGGDFEEGCGLEEFEQFWVVPFFHFFGGLGKWFERGQVFLDVSGGLRRGSNRRVE